MEMKADITKNEDFIKKYNEAKKAADEMINSLMCLAEEYKNNQKSQEALSKTIEQLKAVQEAQLKVIEEAGEGLKNAKSSHKEYADQINETTEKIKNTQKMLESLNTSKKNAAENQKKLNKRIQEYKKELEEANKKQELASDCIGKWEKDQYEAQIALNETSLKIKEYEQYLKEAEENTSRCATSIDQYGKKVKNASEDQEELNEKMTDSGDAVGSLAASLAEAMLDKGFEKIKEALKECIQAASEFESSLAGISVIAGASSMDMDTIKQDILALSSETGQAASALSETVYHAISKNVEAADAVGLVAQATKLAAGGFLDNAASVDLLTTVLNAYHMEAERAEEVSDYLIATQNLGKTTVNELAGSLGEVLPVAAAYNVEMDNLSSAMVLLTSNGMTTAESTSYLKIILSELGDSGSTVSKTLKAQTGESFSTLMEKGHSLGDVLGKLSEAVNSDEDAFDKLWDSSEVGTAAFSLLSSGSKRYNNILKEIRESAGATEKAYAKMTDTAEMSQKKLENAFQNLKIALGSELQEQMKGVYDRGADLVEWAAEFVRQNEWLVPVLEGVTLGIGVFTASLVGLKIVTEVLIPLWDGFTSALKGNPVRIVTFALVELVAVIAPLIASMQDTTNEVEKQAEAWKDQTEALKESMDAYREQCAETEQAVKDTRSLADSLKELISKENKSVAEKQAIADITDKLNEKVSNLGLKYDAETNSINMTTEALDDMLDAMERQEKYKDAKNRYTEIYTQNKESKAAYEEAYAAYLKAKANYDNLEQEYLLLGDDVCLILMNNAKKEMDELEEIAEELLNRVEEADNELDAMTHTMNLYTIETAAMTDAERATVNSMLASAEAKRSNLSVYYEEIELIAQTVQGYENQAAAAKSNMEAIMEQIQALDEKYQESYQTAYDSIQGQLGLFNDMKAGTSISVKKMIENLGTQVTHMEQYAKNIRLAMEYELDKGILSQLTDGSVESAAILQEIVNGGKKMIDDLNTEFGKVSEGKENFSNTIAEMEAYYGLKMEDLVQETENAVKEMAQYDNAFAAAEQTCNGIVDGLDSKWGSVISKYTALANAAVEAYNRAMWINSPSKRFQWSAEMEMEGIAQGLDKKRADVLQKHQNLASESTRIYQEGMEEIRGQEAAIRMAESRSAAIQENYLYAVRSASGSVPAGGTTTQTFNIYTPVKSPGELMRAARLEQQYGLAGE